MYEAQGGQTGVKGVPVTLEDIAAQDRAALVVRANSQRRRTVAASHKDSKNRGKRRMRGAW